MDAGSFPTTIWSEVRRGGARPSSPTHAAGRDSALAELARRYQGPAEAYLRAALGQTREESHELFQEFFAWMLASDFLAKAEPARGRFRAFLKVALRRFATDELRKAAAEKRGGGRGMRALESVGDPAEDAGEGGQLVDRDAQLPEEELDAAWRAALVEQAFEQTRLELERQGRAPVFAVFRDYYLAPGPEPDYRTLAERHALTSTDVSNYLQRAKQAFRGHLRALVLDTVATPADLGDELAWVVARLEGRAAEPRA